ncbi:MAG: ATP-binding cassette domain-containing protein [Planctomycetota bacterium]
MISASDLTKWYGPTLALDRVGFDIEPGQIVGFLGPNGAGKSTAMRILTGFLPPTSGTASIAGHDILDAPDAARAAIGYLPEGTPLYPEMRVEEFLHFRGRLMGMTRADRQRRIDTLVDRCGLSPVRRRVIRALSKGNRQRVGLAQALLHEPPVLILDEPTAGLDPNQITAVRELIAELRGKHTVLLSTHILPEVERTADRVIIIAGGRLVADDTPTELRRQVAEGSRVIVEAKAEPAELESLLKQVPAVESATAQSLGAWSRAVATPKGLADVRADIGKLLLDKSIAVREISREAANLEQFFVQVTDAAKRAASAESSAKPAAA